MGGGGRSMSKPAVSAGHRWVAANAAHVARIIARCGR